jgi:hypothetical protein
VDRVEVLTFYSVVLPEGDPLRTWASQLRRETVSAEEKVPDIGAKIEEAEGDVTEAEKELKRAKEPQAKASAEAKRQEALAKSSALTARLGSNVKGNVQMGAVTVSGRMAPEVISGVVAQNVGRFRACYESALARSPSLSGRVAARFVIGRDGAVSNVGNGGSDLPNNAVVSCVLSALYGLSFPRPEGGIVTVVYPITFSPS